MIRFLAAVIPTGFLIAFGILGIVALWLLPANTDVRHMVALAATSLGLLVVGAMFIIPIAVSDDLHRSGCDECHPKGE